MTLSYFPNTTAEQATLAMKPFLDGARALNASVSENTTTALANDLLFLEDDQLGVDIILGSRLIPAEAYRTNADGIGQAYVELLELGIPQYVI